MGLLLTDPEIYAGSIGVLRCCPFDSRWSDYRGGGVGFFSLGDFLNAYLLFLFVSVCPFCCWTYAFVQEILQSVDWINFCPVGFEYVLRSLGRGFEMPMFHMLTQSDLVIFNRGILSLGTPGGWAGKWSSAPGGCFPVSPSLPTGCCWHRPPPVWQMKMSSDFAKCSLGTTVPPMRTAALIISPSDFTWDPGYGFSLGQPGSRFFCPLMARLTTRPGSCCCSLCNNSSCPFWLSSVPIQTGNHQSLYS